MKLFIATPRHHEVSETADFKGEVLHSEKTVSNFKEGVLISQ